MLRSIIQESAVSFRVPKNEKQKQAMFELIKWAGPKMGAGPEDVKDVIEKANEGDWTEAFRFLRVYYVGKRIPFKNQNF